AGLLEARLLQRVEHRGRADRPAQQHVADPPSHRLREQQQRAPRQVSQHVHQHRGHHVLRVPQQVRHFLQAHNVDLRHADHDLAVRELRQRGGGVARADVRHLAQRVDLQLFEIPHVFHAASPYRSPPASRINAGTPSPMIVAPLNTGSVPCGASNPFTTISCCPNIPSTTTPARRSPISSTMIGARAGSRSLVTASSRRRCTSGTTRSRSTIASRPSTTVVVTVPSSTVSATYVSGNGEDSGPTPA